MFTVSLVGYFYLSSDPRARGVFMVEESHYVRADCSRGPPLYAPLFAQIVFSSSGANYRV